MTVEKKPFKSAADTDGKGKILTFLSNANAFLEQVPTTMINFLNRAFASGESVPQKGVDMVCEWCSWRVNTWVEGIRQKIIKTLHKQYEESTGMIGILKDIQEMVSNPMSILGAVASAVKKILGILLGPFKIMYEFLEELVKELLRLAKNLAYIVSVLPPEPPDPDINFNKFQLSIKSIGMADITTDPENMPAPEEVFKEPIVPFSKEYFIALGDTVRTSYKEELPFYSLPEGYKGSTINLSDAGYIQSVIRAQSSGDSSSSNLIASEINNQIG